MMDIYYQEAIKKKARKILEIYLVIPENTKKNKKGFYLIVTNPSCVVLSESFGELNSLEKEAFFGQAMEKINRLRAEHAQKGDISARQSSEPKEHRFGGAIVAGDYILAVAGLQQLGDETMALSIATELGLMEKKEAGEIITISGNKLFLPLVKAISLSEG